MSFLRVPLSKSPSLDLLKTEVTCHVTSVYSSLQDVYTKLKVNDRSLSSKFQWASGASDCPIALRRISVDFRLPCVPGDVASRGRCCSAKRMPRNPRTVVLKSSGKQDAIKEEPGRKV